MPPRLKERLKRWLFGLLGKDPEAVVVCFRSGPKELADAMSAEVRALIPKRTHFFEVGLEDLPQIKTKFKRYRIALAPVLFTDDPEFEPLRQAAFRLKRTKILAYNTRLERHHLHWTQPIASLLFLRGVPRDRIFLRPWFWPGSWRKADRTVRPTGHREIEGRARSRPAVAILTPYFPYPMSHGGAVRIFSLLREIAREFDILLYAFTEADIADDDLKPVLDIAARVYLVKKPRYREPRWSTLAPPEVGEYDSPEMHQLWSARNASASQVEYTYLAPYGGDILVEHDVTFDLYAQVDARRRTRSSHWDWQRWHRFETRAVEQFKRVVTMSEKDSAMLGVAHARVIENGVDLDRFEPTPEPPAARRLLFIGSFRHFPNIVAYRFLVDEILPLVPDAHLTVVAGPDPWLHWQNVTGTLRPPENPRIKMLEFVADVRPLYEACTLAVVPTLESAGTNVKVLEALAMQRGVVSTYSGAAGLGLTHGVTAWIADSAADIAAGINTLLDDPALRATLAAAGRAHAQKHFDWRAIGRRQRALLREITGDPLTLRAVTPDDLASIARIQAASPEASQWNPSDYLGYDCRVAVLNSPQSAAPPNAAQAEQPAAARPDMTPSDNAPAAAARSAAGQPELAASDSAFLAAARAARSAPAPPELAAPDSAVLAAVAPNDAQAAQPAATQSDVAPSDNASPSGTPPAARFSGQIAGFLATRSTAPGEREILNLAVDPAHRRHGIALRLLEQELLEMQGFGTWFLEVRESNSAAIALYETLGFRVAGRRDDYYQNPPEAGIVMRFLS